MSMNTKFLIVRNKASLELEARIVMVKNILTLETMIVFHWSSVVHFNLWESESKNSVWCILSITTSAGGNYRKNLTFKNRRCNNIYFSSLSDATEYVSYTYRF